MPGGFLGVDAFFVLSGFLITSLLLAERARRGIRLGSFWLRPGTTAAARAAARPDHRHVVFRRLLGPVEVALLRGDALSALGYVANWRMIYRGDDYFTQTAAPSPLQHTWSLGIEEQFYLLWPLIMVGLFVLGRRRTGRALTMVCLIGAAGSAVTGVLLFRPAT